MVNGSAITKHHAMRSFEPSGNFLDRFPRIDVDLGRTPERAQQTSGVDTVAFPQRLGRREHLAAERGLRSCGVEFFEEFQFIPSMSEVQRTGGSVPEAGLLDDVGPEVTAPHRPIVQRSGRLPNRPDETEVSDGRADGPLGALEHHHLSSSLRERVREGESCYSSSDNRNVRLRPTHGQKARRFS